MSAAVCTVIVCSKRDIIVNVNHISCSAVHPFSRCLLLYFAFFQFQALFMQKNQTMRGKKVEEVERQERKNTETRTSKRKMDGKIKRTKQFAELWMYLCV